MLAAQVAKAGDKELADEIMRDAERLVNPQPKNYQDFMLSWMLASGYAEADPDKAFPLLETTILRANETISAFVKVAEFIDVNEEMIDDGEVQVGMFGGSMIRGMTQRTRHGRLTINSLAQSGFCKNKKSDQHLRPHRDPSPGKNARARARFSIREKRPIAKTVGRVEYDATTEMTKRRL